MRGRTGGRLRTAVLGLVFAASGCAGSAFDRSFEAGHYDDALARFAADSSLRDEPRALYRAALARATPDQPTYDPAQARLLLEELVRRFPGGAWHRQAVALLNSLQSTERVARDGARVEMQLQNLRDRIVALEQRLARQESLHDSLATGNVALRDSLERAQRRLRVREAQMQALQDELRALKRIDLAPVATDTSARRQR